jgi:hypothetical protein
MAGLVPGDPRLSCPRRRHPVATVLRDYAPPGLLDRPVKPGDDNGK